LGLRESCRVPNGESVLVYMQINDHCTFELFDHKKPSVYVETDEEHPVAAYRSVCCKYRSWNAHLTSKMWRFYDALCTLPHLGKKVLRFKTGTEPKINFENIMD
jgi:hypothetical protein